MVSEVRGFMIRGFGYGDPMFGVLECSGFWKVRGFRGMGFRGSVFLVCGFTVLGFPGLWFRVRGFVIWGLCRSWFRVRNFRYGVFDTWFLDYGFRGFGFGVSCFGVSS